MQTYIGTKIVMAEPCELVEGVPLIAKLLVQLSQI